VAQGIDLFGEKRPIPIIPNAYKQGFVAGNNMAGGERSCSSVVAMNSIEVCGIPFISVGLVGHRRDDNFEILEQLDVEAGRYKKLVLKDNVIVGAVFVKDIDRAGIYTGLIRNRVNVETSKKLLLTDEFGVLCLPASYRKHVVSGMGIEV
jgi:NAD(P)H-nitrite reductase large subunit